jgi:hypothetical protein
MGELTDDQMKKEKEKLVENSSKERLAELVVFYSYNYD